MKNKKVPADLLAKLPPAESYEKAVFPTLDQQAKAKDIIAPEASLPLTPEQGGEGRRGRSLPATGGMPAGDFRNSRAEGARPLRPLR